MTVAQTKTPVEMQGLDEIVKMLFTRTSEELAYENRFIRRSRKLSGTAYAQALIFG